MPEFALCDVGTPPRSRTRHGHGNRRLRGHRRQPHPDPAAWRIAAKLYLEAFADSYENARWLVKSERKAIGAAWKLAEDNGGRIVFYVS